MPVLVSGLVNLKDASCIPPATLLAAPDQSCASPLEPSRTAQPLLTHFAPPVYTPFCPLAFNFATSIGNSLKRLSAVSCHDLRS